MPCWVWGGGAVGIQLGNGCSCGKWDFVTKLPAQVSSGPIEAQGRLGEGHTLQGQWAARPHTLRLHPIPVLTLAAPGAAPP